MNPRIGNIVKSKNMLPAVVLLTALGATACGASGEQGADRKGKNNPNITSVTIQDGARLRENPIVPGQYEDDGTLLTELDRGGVIETPNGVSTFTDDNGEWYAMSAEEAAGLATDEDDKEAILKDDDGKVWVNDDRATPQYKN